jgi:tetratricopeptide (TPR) repeat protein
MKILKSIHYLLIISVIDLIFINPIGIDSVSASISSILSNQNNQNRLQTKKKGDIDKEVLQAANQILSGGVDYFHKEKYWKCARELIILMDYYPEYERLDEVVYYLGQCLFEEDLPISALRMYKHLLKKYPKSQLVSATLLGVEKTYYHQGNYKMALSVYFAILKRTPEDRELLDAACYFAGQSHFYLKNYDMAINVLKKIDGHSDYYDAALYTIALSYLKKSNVATAVVFFQKIISLPIISGERRNIVDNARLTLGYIYYELKSYQPATQLLLDISNKHENYQDALLALGWALLKMEDYQNVIKYLKKLIKQYSESANAEEAYFLLGQSYIALGEYDNAIESYQTIVDLYQDKVNLHHIIKKVNNSLEQEEDRIEKLKVQILIEESRLIDSIALNGDSKEVPEHIIEEKNKIKDFRKNLIDNLLMERDNLQLMQADIYQLKQLAERRERRKDWKGYAEYGISRALFLKNMKTTRGN